MRDPQNKRGAEIPDSIRQVLFGEWDPIGVNDNANLSDEYDSYITPVYRILTGSRSEEDLVALLEHTERHTMGLPPTSSEHVRQVARRLLSLDVTL
jgi:hypothetical protein